MKALEVQSTKTVIYVNTVNFFFIKTTKFLSFQLLTIEIKFQYFVYFHFKKAIVFMNEYFLLKNVTH